MGGYHRPATVTWLGPSGGRTAADGVCHRNGRLARLAAVLRVRLVACLRVGPGAGACVRDL
jgi:hypothetical protein